MVQEDYVTFDTAFWLKDKGFDGCCNSYYERFESAVTMYKGMEVEWSEGFVNHNRYQERYSRPTHQMAGEWLREKHNVHICVFPYTDEDRKKTFWTYRIMDMNGAVIFDNNELYPVEYSLHRIAYDAAIKHCLENYV